MRVPCETIVRFSKLINPEIEDEIFRTIRLDNGLILTSDRQFLAVEKIEPFEGIFHISVDPVLLSQCVTEAQFSSFIDINPMPMLKYTTAKTTLGYIPSDNIGVYPPGATDFDLWRERIAPCAEPAPVARAAMMWRVDELINLAQSSPSGVLVFEQVIDAETRPTIVRDINSSEWCGFFHPRVHDGLYHGPATMPGWLR